MELFGIDILDNKDFLELVMRFVFNFAVTFFIVRYVYYPKTKQRDFLFTYLLISVVVFFMCFLLESVKLQLGFALGLFAVFGIIRYRTTTIQIREMTYLFIVIGLSVINALANKKVSYAELLFTNLTIVAISYYVENLKSFESELFTIVWYEKIELAKPELSQQLISDLESRTGIKISRVEIINLDYQRDIAKIQVFFYRTEQVWNENHQIDYRIINNEQ